MNRFTAVVAIAMFVLGAVTGHSMNAPATVAAKVEAASALELMMRAPNLDTTVHDAI